MVAFPHSRRQASACWCPSASALGLSQRAVGAILADPAPRWMLAPRAPETAREALQVDTLLLAQLLWNRGIRTASEAASFLDVPDHASWGDPSTMLGVPEATRRLLRAARERERIAIYGDYDVDGLAGTAVLVRTLTRIGAEVDVHIPHRSRDGYGVHAEAIRRLAGEGVRLVVTVDCGVSANREVALARDLGMEVIVTDHHTVPARLPSALAVLNPHQDECEYPYKDLAGGGVALQLCRSLVRAALGRDEARACLSEMAAFAALSTVADVVPLTGENRSIVATGVAAARSGVIPGLAALCEMGGRPLERLSARDLAFTIVPRLNAAGRMGDARDALDLLLAPDATSGREVGARLEQANTARRAQVEDILTEVVPDAVAMAQGGAVVLAGDYPIGLAGLVAGRLAQRFGVPCAVIERGGEQSRGSARGAEDVHLVQVLDECSPLLLQYGGHARAAGFALRSQDIPTFRARFADEVRKRRGDGPVGPTLAADAQIRLSSVGHRLGLLAARFEPVGAGNPPPTFVSRRLSLLGVESFEGGARRVRIAQDSTVRSGVIFDSSIDLPAPGAEIDILFEVDKSSWNGEERLDVIIRSVRPAVS